MKLGIDIMGGDFAPVATIDGVISAYKELPANVELVLIGDEEIIKSSLNERNISITHFQIIHAPEVIGMAEKPTKSLALKPNSSIAVGFSSLVSKDIDAFASAGNTGAMLVGAVLSLGTVSGVLRPCITTILPKENGNIGILLDVGTNPDCKPEVLKQFAIIGSVYAEHVLNIANPKVALLNIGEEEEKGNINSLATYNILKEAEEINFIGNIEGHHLFDEKSDVVVCDGFTGNIVLKTCEALYTLMVKRGIKDSYFDRFNYENYGGTPILGINSSVIIGHGISNAKAIKNMIKLTYNVYKAKLSSKIQVALNEINEIKNNE